MGSDLKKIVQGYRVFRDKYVHGDQSIMSLLSQQGQKPNIMVVACCDSRVDPALILQCDPGDLFVVRNVANIVPPYEKDDMHHGTSAALEFGIQTLEVKHLILLGHSECGGIKALLKEARPKQDDFISHWVSLVKTTDTLAQNTNDYAKRALQQSRQNCLTFPWIAEKILQNTLSIHLWFFDIETGQIFTYSDEHHCYEPLSDDG